MNYSRYKLKAIISSISGLIAFGLSWIVFAFVFPRHSFGFAAVTGLMTVTVTFPVLVAKELWDNRKYKGIEKELGSSVIHSIRAYIETKSGIILSKVYFTEEKIVFACAKGKEFLCENLHLSEIFSVVTDGIFSLNIYTKDKQIFKLNSPEVPEIIPFMKKHSANLENK